MDLLKILTYVLENEKSAFFYTPSIYDNAKSYWLKKPIKSNIITSFDEIDSMFELIQADLDEYPFGYCLIPYESGYLFEESLGKFIPAKYDIPYFEFNHFSKPEFEEIKSIDLSFDEYDKNLSDKSLSIEEFELNTSRETYLKSIRKIKEYIAKGDTYQVNYTVKGNYKIDGEVIHLIYDLIFNQSAAYTTIINTGQKIVVSISPELFIDMDDSKIIAKPMKGTIKRGKNISEDKRKNQELQKDIKNRAENVMIVDLMRNDLGKICEYDSINPISLFDIEQYETLFQMTSTIAGKLKTNNLKEILKNIFPCGSITGAPKIRTMGIIKELETEQRGYYTGSIGLFMDLKRSFNIPIRTLVIDSKTKSGEIGIGSGVVWDSEPEEEYEETLLKANFLLKPEKKYELFETMLFENGKYFLLDYHLERLKLASSYFMFYYDESIIKSKLNELCNSLGEGRFRVKLILNKWGKIVLENSTLNENTGEIKLIISDIKIDSNDKFYYFKTSRRELYDRELSEVKRQGYFESIFMNEKENITEGTITNIFIKRGDIWFTPPVECGLLNGCYRKYLLDIFSNYKQTTLNLKDIEKADSIKVVNSLRKEIPVDTVDYKGKTIFRALNN